MLTKENAQRAWKRVRANKGAAAVDGLDIDQSAEQLKQASPGIRERLLNGMDRPSPMRRVGIPKPQGGERELGIPTVTNRLIQQAVLQVPQHVLDPTFSVHSPRAGERVMGLLRRLYGTLRLQINESKSAVGKVHWAVNSSAIGYGWPRGAKSNALSPANPTRLA